MAGAGLVKIGIIGSQFAAEVHAASFKDIPEIARVVAVCSPTPGHARAFARRHEIPQFYQHYRELLADPAVEAVTIAVPNYLHAEITIAAANAGKHVICEKPLGSTLAEAQEMVDVCRRQGVLLLYAEELLFTPKYAKARELAGQGAFGRIHQIRHTATHFGPHSSWFFNPACSGGGALMDLGCHGIALCRWMLGNPVVKTVYAQLGNYVHNAITCEDSATCILELEDNRLCVIDASWTRPGGMDDRMEIYGDGGVTLANLHMGNALPTYSVEGFGASMKMRDKTKGWTYPVFEELWNYGFPQEMRHFARCIRGTEAPRMTGEDGLQVLEILYAAYASAAKGCKLDFPVQVRPEHPPIEPWLRARGR
jgi:myo-inositol 2-dehydrogenase / D-chiro-inositol 1-dehydrogenase